MADEPRAEKGSQRTLADIVQHFTRSVPGGAQNELGAGDGSGRSQAEANPAAQRTGAGSEANPADRKKASRQANPGSDAEPEVEDNPAAEGQEEGGTDTRLIPPGYVEDDPSTWAVPYNYKTWADVLKAKGASGDEAKKWRDEALRAQAKLEDRDRPHASNGRPEPAKETDWAKEFEEAGLGPEVMPILEKMILDRFGRYFETALKPVVASSEADQRLSMEYPDKWADPKTKAALHRMLEENPDLKHEYDMMVQSNPELAYVANKYVLTQWMNRERAGEFEAVKKAAERERVAKTGDKMSAVVPKSASTTVGSQQKEDDRKRLEELHKVAQDSGRGQDWERYANMRLANVPSIRAIIDSMSGEA